MMFVNKRWIVPAVALVATGAWWVRAQVAPATRPLSGYLPPGALLYLEAQDFGNLLAQWNNSAEKKKWLGSANYDVLSRSRLLGRLQQAQDELQQTSGVSAEMKLLQQVAGKESGFAFYQLGALKFVYITRLEGNRLEANDLWRLRSQYQPRQAGGISFFVKYDSQTGRTVAFASKDNTFVITTDESLMAATLESIAGQDTPSLANEDWFRNVTAARKQGDLRLVYNLQALLKTPQFRTYWIQQNQTELKEYSAGLSDLFENANGFEEQRLLLRPTANAAPRVSGELERLVSSVPQDSSLYRAWANPSSAQLTQALTQVVRSEAPPAVTQQLEAPHASGDYSGPNYSPDLETKIDEPETKQSQVRLGDQLAQGIQAMQPTALLHVQNTVALRDNVFVVPGATVAIACTKPDLTAVQRVLNTSESLDPLTVTLQSNVLVLSRGGAHLAITGAPSTGTTTYAAGYRHAAEWPKYTRLFHIVDAPKVANTGDASNPVPLPYFSGNLQSLGDSLSRLQRATLVRNDNGSQIAESVRYEMK
jgi:hypothetical protein